MHVGYFFLLMLSSADFIPNYIFRTTFQEHYHNVKGSGSLGPDLGPNCLQMFPVDDTSHRLQGKS